MKLCGILQESIIQIHDHVLHLGDEVAADYPFCGNCALYRKRLGAFSATAEYRLARICVSDGENAFDKPSSSSDMALLPECKRSCLSCYLLENQDKESQT